MFKPSDVLREGLSAGKTAGPELDSPGRFAGGARAENQTAAFHNGVAHPNGLFALDRDRREPRKAECVRPCRCYVINAPPYKGTSVVDRDHP